jgi:hypothetical protein
MYVENFKLGTNKDIGPKGMFEMSFNASNRANTKQSQERQSE